VKEQPAFEEKYVLLEKKNLLSDIKSGKDNPSSVASKIFAEKMFGRHPYGRPSYGDEKKVAKMRRAQLLSFHEKLARQPQVLSITGHVSAAEVRRLLEQYLSGRKWPAVKKPTRMAVSHPKKPAFIKSTLKKEQSHIILGFPSTTLYDKDRWALTGLAALLGGQGGRLFMELRDKLSLCYTVSPTHMEGLDGGYFGFYIATAPEKIAIAISGLEKEIERLLTTDIPQDEWEKAREFYIGNFEIEQQRLAPQAMGMALDEIYGFGFPEYFRFEEHLRALTVRDLHAAAKKYLGAKAQSRRVTVIVGPAVSRT